MQIRIVRAVEHVSATSSSGGRVCEREREQLYGRSSGEARGSCSGTHATVKGGTEPQNMDRQTRTKIQVPLLKNPKKYLHGSMGKKYLFDRRYPKMVSPNPGTEPKIHLHPGLPGSPKPVT